ncbi:hypothetical protein HA402_014784 [Bradysia odoriphaga]|nr:hypothetical protein HA402_014784 [Bradysia odoriphaga]
MHNCNACCNNVWFNSTRLSSVGIDQSLFLDLELTNRPLNRGYLGPGGKQDNATNPNCIGGATGYVDEIILGSKHIYRWPTAGSVYDASAFDPEGMVGCLTTFLQVFIGLQCGVTLLVYTGWKDRVARLLIWGIVLGVIGGSLCLFSQENGVIPINKNLWSLSFVFVTCALAYLLLTLFYMLVDVLNWWSGTPLVYAGMNAILLYVGHSIIGSMFPWRWSIGPMNTHLVLLVENMWHAVSNKMDLKVLGVFQKLNDEPAAKEVLSVVVF